jgi:hypothetical protein
MSNHSILPGGCIQTPHHSGGHSHAPQHYHAPQHERFTGHMDPVQLHGGIGATGSNASVDIGGALTFPLGSGSFLDVGAHAGTTVFNGQHSNHAVGGITIHF